MLKKLDIKLFIFALSSTCCLLSTVFLSGCSTEYNIVTGKEESYFYSTDKEVAMGNSISKEVEKEYKYIGDPLVQNRIENIGKKIVAVCDRKDIDYHFFVLDDEEVNAVSLPGGYVYVFKGLIDKTASDDELAGVLAHEVGHIVARHAIKRLQAEQSYSILRLLVLAVPQSANPGAAGNAADLAFTELLLGYSREDELLADKLGARYSKLAGYNPEGMISFLEKLQQVNKRKPLAPKSYFKTHPYVPDRIREVKQELGKGIDFDDYINIEQKPHE
jgi:predicted Zn-dependent protease